MTRRIPNPMSWDTDSKTAVEVPTHQSQQRLKAIARPNLSWEDDARTVAAPADAALPAEAFREPPPNPVFDLSRAPEAAAPPPPVAVPSPVHSAFTTRDLTTENALPIAKRRPSRRRWLLLGVLLVALYGASYVTVSLIQGGDQPALVKAITARLKSLSSSVR